MKIGTHKVTITDAYVSKSKQGTPRIVLAFENEEREKIYHYLSLTDTVQKDGLTVAQRSVQTLVKCGYTGRDIDIISVDLFKEVDGGIEIVVHEEFYEDKAILKVQYINFGFEGKKNVMERAEIKSVSTKFNLSGEIAKTLAAMKGKYAETKPVTEFISNDIPF
jgi:hypothetical protein